MVAEKFGKQHKNILRDIETLGCSDNFKELNFERLEYDYRLHGGGIKQVPEYIMTKDGFTFLVMGFRGQKGWLHSSGSYRHCFSYCGGYSGE
jgi:Rha family phage regulatory protein